MRTRELTRWLDRLSSLTPHQRSQVQVRLQALAGQDAVTELLAQRAAPPQCPGCASAHLVRNGQATGLQRFKCRGCGITFNGLTGTPLARLRHRGKWLEQAEVLEEGLSVRKAAARLGVHRTTAFRWRHRFLSVPSQVMDRQQSGVVEADEAYFLRSYKGQPRRLREATSRPARRRGGRAAKRGLSDEQVPVLVVRNRSGHTADFGLASANKAGLVQVLPQAVMGDAVLCTDGSAMLAAAARELGLEHHGLNTLRGERRRGAWHIQNVNAYHSRLKGWLHRFRGVATSYLTNYLGWFRALDRNRRTGANASALLALAIAG
ncbi:IS1595 family transposase [Pseudomonas aeruginosa]